MNDIEHFELMMRQHVFPEDTGHAIAFWKGRVALYAILRAIGVKPGDEIILPAYTCVVVPNAILYCNAIPVYCDINPLTWTLAPQSIEECITPRTRVILAQNTLGLAADLDSIIEIAERHRLVVIEDCAHGLGGSYKGRPNGSAGLASFMSFQWNKTISTGLGGMAFTSSDTVALKLRELQSSATPVGPTLETQMRAQLFAYACLKDPRLYWATMQSYRFLSRLGLAVGSSDPIETESVIVPPGYFRALGNAQARAGIGAVNNLPQQLVHRRATAAAYRNCLESLGIAPCTEPTDTCHAYLRFPLLVRDKHSFMAEARKCGIEIGEWLNSPLHPVQSGLERWGYRSGSAPVAEMTAARMVNLPTHTRTVGAVLQRNLDFIRNNAGLICERQTSEA